MRHAIPGILSIAILLLSASAHAAFIDFEGFAAGDNITGQNISGATFTVTNNTGTDISSNNPLMIFDSANPTGGDSDLATPSFGNILIISEDGDANDPDDNAGGGVIIATFDTAVTSITGVTVDVGDSNNKTNSFEVFLNGASVELMLLANGLGDNNIQTKTFTGLFDEIRLSLGGSGALASLEFTTVPVPAALPLLLAGLLSMFGLFRKHAV